MAEPEQPLPDLLKQKFEIIAHGDPEIKLNELTAQATAKYSVKDYDAAAELYAYATELQAEINGEMSSKNADLLYAYGRCLYHVAVKKSDVLGQHLPGDVPDGQPKAAKMEQKRKRVEDTGSAETGPFEDSLSQSVRDKEGPVESTEEVDHGNKLLFQFTGDENFEDSGDDVDEEDGDGDKEDTGDEDDFVMAYEMLDMARVLLQKKIAEAEKISGKGKEKDQSQEVRQLNERLADTYDLQAEISLEGEKFPIAVIDLKSAVKLKNALYDEDSSLIAEAHYKLSLALEFSSVTQQKDRNGETTDTHVDEEMREEAAHELEAAINSCKLRIKKEEARLNDSPQIHGEDGKLEVTKEDIDEVKDMVKDLQQRLVEIRQPSVSIKDPSVMGNGRGANQLSGLLSSMLGESPAAQKARVEEATIGANDLTSLVKKKKQDATKLLTNAAPESAQSNVNGKRKVESNEEVNEIGSGKKVKISESGESCV